MRIRPFGPLVAVLFFTLVGLAAPFLPAADDDPLPGLIVALKGNKEAVYGVAFSADGKHLVTTSGEPAIKVWELPSGKEFKAYLGSSGHKGLIVSVALAPDNSQFATAGADNTARVWDFPTTRPIRDFAHTVDPRSVAVTNDGNKLALGGKDGKIRLWNKLDDKQPGELAGHTGPVTGLAFSPNAQALVSVGTDGTLRHWNTADGKMVNAIAAHPGEVASVGFGPGGNVVYTSGPDGSLRFWAFPAQASRSFQPVKDPITALGLSADGQQVVSATGKSVRLSPYATGQTTREFTGAKDPITSVAVSSAGAHVAAAANNRLFVWQNKDGAVLSQQVAHPSGVTSVTFNAAGNQLASVGKDGMLRLWTVPPIPDRVVTHPDAVRAAFLSSDGKRLITAGADKLVRVYQLPNLTAPERQFSGHAAGVNAVALSADGKTLASAGEDQVIRFWSLTKGDQTGQIGAHTAAINSLTYLPGELVLSSSTDGSVKVWRAPAAAQGKGVFSHAGPVSGLVLSPDGSRLLTGCGDKQARIWMLSNGQVERTFTGPTLAILSVAYSARGDRVAAASADKSIHVWEAATNKPIAKLVNLPSAVNGVALAADGKQAVAGLADGSVRIYDLATTKELKSLQGHKGAVNALVLTPKGDQVISAGADGLVLVQGLAGGPATSVTHPSAALAVAVSRDGSQLAIGGAGKQISLHSLPMGKQTQLITTPAEVRGLAYSADGKRLAVAGGDNQARVYSSDGTLEEYLNHEGPVVGVVYSADGKSVFTASADKTARTWTTSLVWSGRHDGPVRQAIISPRGDRVFSASEDGTVRQWNLADGKALQTIRAHAGAVIGVSLSADVTRMLTAGADKVARTWELPKLVAGKTGGKDVDTASVTMTLPAAAEAVAISPNGLRAAVGVVVGGKEQIRLFDTVAGKELLALGEVDGAPARSLAFQADNRTLLAAGADRTARLLDVNLVTAFETHPGGASSVAYNPASTHLATAGVDKSVKLWALATGKMERAIPVPEAAGVVCYSRDGVQVAATAGKVLKVFSVADGKEVASIDMPSPASSLSFNADRQRLSTSHEDGRARVWDVVSKRELQGFLHTGAVTGAVFHPSQPQVISAGVDGVVNVDTLSANRLVVVGSATPSLAVSSNSTHVATASADGKVRLYNIGSGNVDRTSEGDKAQTSVAISRNNQLIASGGADRKVRVFNFNDGKLLSAFNTSAEVRALAFSASNQALVAAGADGSLTTWDVTYNPGQPLVAEFGKVLQTYQHAGEALDLAFPGVGAVFYTAGADKTVKAWRVPSDAPVRTLAHPVSVNCVTYSKDGSVLATGAADGRIRLFDMAKGALLREIVAHSAMNNTAIYCVAFSPDGKQVVSGSVDQTLKLFNVADGKPIKEFKPYKEKEFEKGHQEAVLTVAFSPDGKQIASAGMDRSIKIWNTADGNVVREMINPAYKPVAGLPAPAHPGWVYSLRWTEKALYSAGGAPRLRGYLASWEPGSGKMLTGKELEVGTIFSLAISPDEKALAIGTGGSIRSERDLNLALVLPLPLK